MRRCVKCKEEKPDAAFSKRKLVKSGFNSSCKECANKYAKGRYLVTKSKGRKKGHSPKEYYKERLAERRALIDSFKEKHPCPDCGNRFPAICMDFDHVRGEKIGSVSAMWSWDAEKLLEEIAKCDVVCACCHRLRTQRRLQLG